MEKSIVNLLLPFLLLRPLTWDLKTSHHHPSHVWRPRVVRQYPSALMIPIVRKEDSEEDDHGSHKRREEEADGPKWEGEEVIQADNAVGSGVLLHVDVGYEEGGGEGAKDHAHEGDIRPANACTIVCLCV